MKNNKKLRKWLDDFKLDHPLVIAGPCSAETEAQMMSIANELKGSDVSILELVYGNLGQGQVCLKALVQLDLSGYKR